MYPAMRLTTSFATSGIISSTSENNQNLFELPLSSNNTIKNKNIKVISISNNIKSLSLSNDTNILLLFCLIFIFYKLLNNYE